jgi:hypothetical protein
MKPDISRDIWQVRYGQLWTGRTTNIRIMFVKCHHLINDIIQTLSTGVGDAMAWCRRMGCDEDDERGGRPWCSLMRSDRTKVFPRKTGGRGLVSSLPRCRRLPVVTIGGRFSKMSRWRYTQGS